MSLPSGKLFVPDQAIYWLDAKAELDKPIDKREWLQTHNLPEFEQDPKKGEKTPWIRIDGIQARNEFLKNLGPIGDPSKRKLLCFTASAGVGKSIALDQIAYLRSLDPEHVVIRYHFSELPTNSAHFWLAGLKQRSQIQSETTRPLVLALLNTVFPSGDEDQNWPTLSDAYEQAILLLIETKIQKGQVTLIVDGLDEFNGIEDGATEGTRKERAKALKSLLNSDKCRNLHCVVAGRPYSIVDDNWADLFESKGPSARTHGSSEWEFCLAALFTEDQSKRFLGARYERLGSLQSQTPLTPRHLEVIRTLPEDRFGNLHSLACVYWEMLQASLVRDLTRKDKKDLYGPPKVPVSPEQYLGYLAAVAFLSLESPSDLKSLDLDEYGGVLFDRVMQIESWKYNNDSIDRKKRIIAELNSSTIEFNHWQQGRGRVVWKDRTVMDFFAALWLVRYATDEQREAICKQVPRQGNRLLYENRRDLWTFIAGMPYDAFETFDNLPLDARWLGLVHRLFQRFTDAKRPTQLMYIAWCTLTADATKGEASTVVSKSISSDEVNPKQVVGLLSFLRRFFHSLNGSKCSEFEQLSNRTGETIIHLFHQSYSIAKDGRGRRARIIREDLESQFKSIPPPEGGWDHVEVGHNDQPDNQPRTVKLDGPFEVCAYPVTQRLYALFDPQHKVVFRSELKRFSPHPRCPAISISWYDAMMFAAWTGSRLMNEQEWEYACRANIRDVDTKSGPLSEYFWNDDPEGKKLHDHAWVGENSQAHTWPVDTKAIGSHTNPFKLVDMLGNVWEWTDSLYKVGYVSRVLRGGSFNFHGRVASASFRILIDPTDAYILIGFRVARAPEGKS